MGLVYKYKKTKQLPSKLSVALRIKIKKAAQSMSLKQVKDFLVTKVKKLPKHKKTSRK